jgi:DNA-binding MarR family transcriptional regulator
MAEPRWLDAAEQRAWRSYLRMQGQLSARLNRQLQLDSGLSLADFDVLVQLTDVPAARVRVSELARSLQWEKSRLSHHVARMERRGLVRREECTDDGRGSFVVLTEAGRTAIESAAPPHVDAVRRFVFDDLTPVQLEALSAITAHVLSRLEADD